MGKILLGFLLSVLFIVAVGPRLLVFLFSWLF